LNTALAQSLLIFDSRCAIRRRHATVYQYILSDLVQRQKACSL
jgi:hypothetical protein